MSPDSFVTYVPDRSPLALPTLGEADLGPLVFVKEHKAAEVPRLFVQIRHELLFERRPIFCSRLRRKRLLNLMIPPSVNVADKFVDIDEPLPSTSDVSPLSRNDHQCLSQTCS